MAAICVRGLPDEAKGLLRLRAARTGRSMEAELRHILIRALLHDGPVPEAAVDRPSPGGYADGPQPELPP